MLPLVADDGATLQHLVDVLGPSVLRVLTSPGLHRAVVRDVVIHDVADPPTLRRGDVLLGVGLVPNSDNASKVMEEAGAAGAAAVVVRSREADLPHLRRAAMDNDVTLMVLPAAMRWSRSLCSCAALWQSTPRASRVTPRPATCSGSPTRSPQRSTAPSRSRTPPATCWPTRRRTRTNWTCRAGRPSSVDGCPRPTWSTCRRAASSKRSRPPTMSCGWMRMRRLGYGAGSSSRYARTMSCLARSGCRRAGCPWGPRRRPHSRRRRAMPRAHLIRAHSTGLTMRQRREDSLRAMLTGDAEVDDCGGGVGFDAELACAVAGRGR